MTKNAGKLILGTLTIFSLTVPLSIGTQVQANPPYQEGQLIAVANKGEELKSGKFETLEQRTSGEVRLVRLDNGRIYIDFDENFRTEEGPDLFVILSRSATLEKTGSSDGEKYYTVSPLLKVRGEQRYILPGNFDLNEYQSIGIWCRQMNVIFGAATLK